MCLESLQNWSRCLVLTLNQVVWNHLRSKCFESLWVQVFGVPHDSGQLFGVTLEPLFRITPEQVFGVSPEQVFVVIPVLE